jgi:hypothetical protein|tara:strand:+ start:331 stop:639 length:309 start_codon:yes stop_codon:yes gene_type:complete
MKDKRTYTNQKEHGEDMSLENEIKIEPGNLPALIELHQREIWQWKQKEANWIKTENLLNGSKQIIDELSVKLAQMARKIQELQYDNNTYKKEIDKLLAEKNK